MVKEEEKGDGQMKSEEANPTYTKWLLDAIRKVKRQKQRPSLERIYHAVRQHHEVNRDIIAEQLEMAVTARAVLKVFNKGVCSYKDPVSNDSQSNTRTLIVGKKTNLSRVIVKTIKELGESEGSTARNIEKRIRTTYELEVDDGVDLNRQIRLSLKRAVKSGLLQEDGRLYRRTPADNSDSMNTSGSSTTSTLVGDDDMPFVDRAIPPKNKVSHGW